LTETIKKILPVISSYSMAPMAANKDTPILIFDKRQLLFSESKQWRKQDLVSVTDKNTMKFTQKTAKTL